MITHKCYRYLFIAFLTMAILVAMPLHAQEQVPKVSDAISLLKVSSPYLEVRSGPSDSYPVIYTLKQDALFKVTQRKTDWFLIGSKEENSRHEKQGWIDLTQIESSTIDGKQIKISTITEQQFNNKLWEMGFSSGQTSEKDPLVSVYTGFHITPNLSFEMSYTQFFEQFATSSSNQFNLTHEIAPEWIVSPLFTLGVGSISIDPKETLGGTNPVKKDALNFGFGGKYYISERFFLRADYHQYVLLSNNDSLDTVDSWKIGLSVFF